MRPDQYMLTVRTDTGVAGLVGFETGDMIVVARQGATLVTKTAGGGFWSGRGMDRSYAPTEFTVWHICEVRMAGLLQTITVDRLIEFPLRAKALTP